MPLEEFEFEKNFQVGPFLFEKVTGKGRISPGETFEGLLDESKQRSVDWFKKNNPGTPQLATDYFKGPETIKQVEPVTNEQADLEKIKIGLNNFQNQADATAFIEKEFPDYINHVRVKMIIKTKPLKKSNGKVSGKKN